MGTLPERTSSRMVEVRAAIPPDMVKMIRHPQDDPVILETYV